MRVGGQCNLRRENDDAYPVGTSLYNVIIIFSTGSFIITYLVLYAYDVCAALLFTAFGLIFVVPRYENMV